eukprot:g36353.t1
MRRVVFSLFRRSPYVLGVGASLLLATQLPSPSLSVMLHAFPSTGGSGTACADAMSQLPGDPSIVLHVNVDLGKDKLAVMQAISKAIATCFSKPENFVAVLVEDNNDIIWAGQPTPCALATVCSIGAINQV